jgi:hypothetical protein
MIARESVIQSANPTLMEQDVSNATLILQKSKKPMLRGFALLVLTFDLVGSGARGGT